MVKRRKILKSFPWKGRMYNKGGEVPESRFTDIEIKVLQNSGFLDKEEAPKKAAKKSNKK